MLGQQPKLVNRLIFAFAIVYVVWGSTYLGIRYAIETIPPFLLAGVRFTTAGAILYLWSRAQGIPRPSRIHWRNALIIGVFLLLMGNGGVVWAQQTVPSGIAALLIATEPVWLVLLDSIHRRRRPSTGVIAGMVMGLIGMIVLVGFKGVRGTIVPTAGAIVIIFASLSWATGSLFAQTAERPRSFLGTGIEMLCGGLCLLMASALTGELHTFDVRQVSLESALAFGYLLIFGSLVAYTAYSWLLRHASPAMVSTYAYVNPVIAVFLGWLIVNEPVTKQTLLGAAIIVAGVIAITTSQAKEAKATRRTE